MGLLSSSQLLELESMINETNVYDLPIGAMLNDVFMNEFFLKNEMSAFITYSKQGLKKYVYPFWHYIKNHRKCSLHNTREKGLITWMGSSSRVRSLVLPIIGQLEPDFFLVVTHSHFYGSLLPEFVDWLSVQKETPESMSKCVRNFLLSRKMIKTKLHDQLHLWGRQKLYHVILSHLFIQIYALERAFSLVHKVNPTFCLTEYDRNGFTSPLILACKKFGIPTYTLQHGVIETDYGYTPLLADTIFVWGVRSQKKLERLGVEPHRIVVAGHPGLSFQFNISRDDVCQKIGLSPERKVVMLATDPFDQKSRLQFARSFCEAFPPFEEFQPIIRLHPSEDLSGYRSLQKKYEHVLFQENHELSLEESLSLADVVVTHHSGYGLDALVYGKPVVVFDVLQEPLMYGEDLVQDAGMPCARSPHELREIIQQIFTVREFKRTLEERGKKFVSAECARFGDDAGRFIAEYIRQDILS